MFSTGTGGHIKNRPHTLQCKISQPSIPKKLRDVKPCDIEGYKFDSAAYEPNTDCFEKQNEQMGIFPYKVTEHTVFSKFQRLATKCKAKNTEKSLTVLYDQNH